MSCSISFRPIINALTSGLDCPVLSCVCLCMSGLGDPFSVDLMMVEKTKEIP